MVEDELRKAVAADLWTIPMGKVVDLVTRAAAEIVSLRAELASSQERISELYRAQKNTILSAKSVEYDIDALLAAARQDVEEKARLKQSVSDLEDGISHDRQEISKLIGIIRSVVGWYDGLKPNLLMDIEQGRVPKAIARTRAALACRPQGEQAPSPAPAAGGVIPSARPQDGG